MTSTTNPKPPLLRQSSGSEQKECFCCEVVGNSPTTDVRLACNCLIHRQCLVTYLRSQLGDKIALLSTMDRLHQTGIICPYVTANACNGSGVTTFISLTDLEILLSTAQISTVVNSDNNVSEDYALSTDEIARFQRWIEEDRNSLLHKTNLKVEEPSVAKTSTPADRTDEYITATTKPCPSCNMRVTHWHGHSCHHIQPGGGCPNCREPFCYKCLNPGKTNAQLRGGLHLCVCGGWSNFCKGDDIEANINSSPYPYDIVRFS